MAFYSSHRDVSIVLTDDEEMQLVRELAGPNRPQDVVWYNVHRSIRRKYERLMFDHLKRTLADDPEFFRVKYWYRSRYFQDAIDLFRLYIDATGGSRETRFPVDGVTRTWPKILESHFGKWLKGTTSWW
jgi:hypothetical protein